GRLNKSGEKGVIGGVSYPNPTSQPGSMVYWTALGAWGILRTLPDGTRPSRSAVHRMITRKPSRVQLHDDDKQLLDEDSPIFSNVPAPPKEWNEVNAALDFRLSKDEKPFLRSCLLAVSRPENAQIPSLLSRLVEQGVEVTERLQLWGGKVQA